MADAHLEALRASVTRLHRLASGMNQAELTQPAYPTEWSVADVLSHLGSGAVITRRRLEDSLTGHDTPDDFAPAVWDTWNAKGPVARRDDALAGDAELLARLDAVTAAERASFTTSMGPLTLDFEQFVGMRLNEHALHTWDIEVVRDPAATLPEQAAELVIDNLDLIARFTAEPTGASTTITVSTTAPPRGFRVELTPEAVSLAPADPTAADLELPAEAFSRLVYGRLDPNHTPAGDHSASLDLLRHVFPGP
jgi:uncharacterized protein (TIGR03083 family)